MILFKLYMFSLVLQKDLSFRIKFAGFQNYCGTMEFLKLILAFFLDNKLMWLLFHLGMSALFMLICFFVYLLEIYTRGLTINEKEKHTKVMEEMSKNMKEIDYTIDTSKGLNYENMSKLGDELFTIYRWILFWERRSGEESFFRNLFSILFL